MNLHEHYIRSAIQQADEALRCIRAAWSERESRSSELSDAALYLDWTAHKLRSHQAALEARAAARAATSAEDGALRSPYGSALPASSEGGAP